MKYLVYGPPWTCGEDAATILTRLGIEFQPKVFTEEYEKNLGPHFEAEISSEQLEQLCNDPKIDVMFSRSGKKERLIAFDRAGGRFRQR